MQHAQGHIVLAGKFHSAYLQYLRAHTGHFQHFFKGNPVEAARAVHDTWIGGVDAVDIRVDLALVGLEGRSEGDCRGIGAAAAKCGNTAVFVHALKTRHHHDGAVGEIGVQALVIDFTDAGLGMGTVGENAHL